MTDAYVGVPEPASPAKLIDNEQLTTGAGVVYRQRIADSADYEYSFAVGPESSPGSLVTASGDTTIKTPSSGKKLRLRWLSAVSDPAGTTPPYLKFRFGSSSPFYGVYALQKRQRVTGGTNEALVVNLSTSGSVAVSIIYEEVT